MKAKIFTLLLVCLTGISTSHAQWSMETINTGDDADFIECLDGHTCYAGIGSDFTGGSKVFKTTDGSTWTAVVGNGLSNADTPSELVCLDENLCFLNNEGGLFKTTDGGVNWTNITSILYPSSLSFPESNLIGFAGGTQEKVLKTIDGGQNWSVLYTFPNLLGITKLDFIDNQTGILCAKNSAQTNIQIFKTSNGGSNWALVYDEVANSSQGLLDIQFVSANVAYACGTNGRVLKSIDGGDNWSLLANPNSGTIGYTALDFINTSNGYIVGALGKIIKTIDGGTNWIEEDFNTNGNFDISIGNLDTVYVSNGGNIFINSTAGLTASIIDIQNNKLIGKIYPNPSNEKMIVSINENKAGLAFKLLDLLGNEIRTTELNGNETEIFQEDISNGTYIYQIFDKNELLSTGKLMFN